MRTRLPLHIGSIPPIVARLLLAVMLLAAMLPLPSGIASAQEMTTKGTDFWLGFMENLGQGADIFTYSVHITSDRATSGTLSIPLRGWSQSFAVPAKGSASIVLPSWVVATGSGHRADLGIHVVTLDSVSVFLLNHAPATTDAALVLPTPALGGEYITMAYSSPGEGHLYPAELMVVGARDGTTVEITPSVKTLDGRAPGIPFAVKLAAGEVYQIQAEADLTGTRVRSSSVGGDCPPFALFGGAKISAVGGCGFADHLVEQMTPLPSWGRSFAMIPLLTRDGDLFRIMAARDGTRISIDGGPEILLNAGAYLDTLVREPRVVRADQPLTVAQFSRGGQCDGVAQSDPFMVLLSPLEQPLSSIVFDAFSTPTVQSHYVNVVARSAEIGGVALDGVPISTSFTPITAAPEWSYARFAIVGGNHVLEGTGVMATVYAFGPSESYGYAAGLRLDPLPASIGLTSSSPSADGRTFCVGGSALLTAFGDATVDEWTWHIDGVADVKGRELRLDLSRPGTRKVTLFGDRAFACRPRRDSAAITITILPLPEPTIVPTTPLSLCDVDSARLRADQPYATYRWSTGETTPEIAVGLPGTYTVTVTNAAGCSATSAPITVAGTHPETPAVRLLCTCQGVMLQAPEGFQEYAWSNGGHERTMLVEKADEYRVTVTNEAGCSATSEPIFAEPSEPTPEVTLDPRLIERVPGDTLNLWMHVPAPAAIASLCPATSGTFVLSFDATLLAPVRVDGAMLAADTAIDGHRRLTLTASTDTVIGITLMAALGAAETTPIELAGFGWGACEPAPVGKRLALFRLGAICRQGGTRLFADTDTLLLRSALPDPATSSAAIEYGVIERGRTRLLLVDAAGRSVARLVDAELEPGRYRVDVDVARLPSGTYRYILRTPTGELSRSLRVLH